MSIFMKISFTRTRTRTHILLPR